MICRPNKWLHSFSNLRRKLKLRGEQVTGEALPITDAETTIYVISMARCWHCDPLKLLGC